MSMQTTAPDQLNTCASHNPCPTTEALYHRITDGATPDDLEFWIAVFEMARAGLLIRGWSGSPVNAVEHAYRVAHTSSARRVQQQRALMAGALPFAPSSECKRGHSMADAVIRRDGKRECRTCKVARDDARRNARASGVQPPCLARRTAAVAR